MEKQAPYGTPEQELPSYLEKVQSQLPALQILIQMGWVYLTPDETVNLRSGRLGSSILEPVLLEHIRNNCHYRCSSAITLIINPRLWPFLINVSSFKIRLLKH